MVGLGYKWVLCGQPQPTPITQREGGGIGGSRELPAYQIIGKIRGGGVSIWGGFRVRVQECVGGRGKGCV